MWYKYKQEITVQKPASRRRHSFLTHTQHCSIDVNFLQYFTKILSKLINV